MLLFPLPHISMLLLLSPSIHSFPMKFIIGHYLYYSIWNLANNIKHSKQQPTPAFLPQKSRRRRSLSRLQSTGSSSGRLWKIGKPAVLRRVTKSWTRLSDRAHRHTICCCCLVTKSCPTLLRPHDQGSSVHGILQARILEGVAISFSRGSSRPRDQTHVSCIADSFFTTEPAGKPFTVAWEWSHGAPCVLTQVSALWPPHLGGVP